MFVKSKEPEVRPLRNPAAAQLQRPTRGAPSIISADLIVQGTLSAGDVQVDGKVDGDIRAGGLVIGDERSRRVCQEVIRGRARAASAHAKCSSAPPAMSRATSYTKPCRSKSAPISRAIAATRTIRWPTHLRTSPRPNAVPLQRRACTHSRARSRALLRLRSRQRQSRP